MRLTTSLCKRQLCCEAQKGSQGKTKRSVVLKKTKDDDDDDDLGGSKGINFTAHFALSLGVGCLNFKTFHNSCLCCILTFETLLRLERTENAYLNRKLNCVCVCVCMCMCVCMFVCFILPVNVPHLLKAEFGKFIENNIVELCNPEYFKFHNSYLFDWAGTGHFPAVHLLICKCILKISPVWSVPLVFLSVLMLIVASESASCSWDDQCPCLLTV
jgi:hypothetical protein